MQFNFEKIKKPIEKAVKTGILVAATSLPVFAQNQKPIEKDTLPSKEIKTNQDNIRKDSTYIIKDGPINNPEYKKNANYLENSDYLNSTEYKKTSDYLINASEINQKNSNIELNFTNKTNIEFSREILNKIDFIKLSFDYNTHISVAPDSTGNYDINIPCLKDKEEYADRYIVLKNVSPECLNNFIGKIEGENVNEVAAPDEKIENATLRPTIKYDMPIEDFIKNEEMLKDFQKQKKEEKYPIPKKVRVKQYHENWDTFIKNWQESSKN